MDSTPPNNIYEALGLPSPRPDVQGEPLVLEAAGKTCDFAPSLFADSSCGPVVWAFPCGTAERVFNIGGTGRTMSMSIAAGLWYACERCRSHVKHDRWAALTRDFGFPEGQEGNADWEAFRVARLPGNGYAWPLVPHKLPTVHKAVREAWTRATNGFDDEIRSRLLNARVLLEVEGRLYVRCERADDVEWLAQKVGERLTAALIVLLGRQVTLSLLPPA
ncbi:hypothetical protein ABZT26_35335 [Streptomyces sp. NPDC005395]|uniref:hypothetical protein n=1 Tax=Streptomyces sp. NPDC005395 TaxID=3157042 RepID=UPI0033A88792